MSNATIQLQAIGTLPAIPANELTAGTVTVWNFGSTETILERVKETAKSVWFKISFTDSRGETKTATRQFRKDRLVGVQA